MDLLAEQVSRLKETFPEVITEGKIDFDKLRATLGDEIDDRPERYSFTWAGKRNAIRLLQTSSRATLIPAPKESINFEETGNVFIEGENLEVLKLLYKSYFGRVKMIYIDPPYNTGNDFIYPDNYADPLDTYLRLTGQKDAEGNLLTSNPETSGRYHSAWLSMMYPRLFLARQLLRDDGVIFVSIDDREVHDLRLIMNEIFGEENFVTTFVRKRRMATGMRGEPVSPDHEYVAVYARALETTALYGATKADLDYPFEDSKGKYRSTDLTVGMTKQMRPKQFYASKNPRTGKSYWPPEDRVWRFQKSTMQKQIKLDNIIWPDDYPDRRMTRPRFKTRQPPPGSNEATKPVSTWIDSGSDVEDENRLLLEAGLNQEATKELKELFGTQIYDYPKPVSLVKELVNLGSSGDDLVFDFFAGSSTTAQAVLELNRLHEGNRRFIMVQLPEPTPEKSAAREAGFETIADIGKERIRRVIKNMKKEGQSKSRLDFKVFKLSQSNFRHWEGLEEKEPTLYSKEMELYTDPLRKGWKPENVIWQVAVREGYSLTSKIEKVSGVRNATIYMVTDPDKEQSFHICLDDKIKLTDLKSLHFKQDDLFICRDIALDDEAAANLALQCRLKTI